MGTKILTKILSSPNEAKYQNLNHDKIKSKFTQFQCEFMVELLIFAGFTITDNRLILMKENHKIELILAKLNEKIKSEQDKLEKEKLQIIEQNKQRLATKSILKKKAVRDKILSQHKQQMTLAKNGIYNVKACVSDRKGKGGAINSLF